MDDRVAHAILWIVNQRQRNGRHGPVDRTVADGVYAHVQAVVVVKQDQLLQYLRIDRRETQAGWSVERRRFPQRLIFPSGPVPETLSGGRNFGHLAYEVDDVYAICQRLMDAGVTINRPPHDGHMAFVRSPDGISIELLQRGPSLPPSEPWVSMGNTGSW